MNPCGRFRAQIREFGRHATPSVSDELALHLDACGECRRLFDLERVDLAPGVFEVFAEPARRRVLEALGTARLARPRSRRLVAVACALAVTFAGVSYVATIRMSTDRATDAFVEDHIRYLHHPDRRSPAQGSGLESHLQAYVEFPVELPAPLQRQLTGGRRCFLLGRRVALAFYDTPRGPASYFILSAKGLRIRGSHRCEARGLTCNSKHGYHLVSWESAGLLHVLVGPHESTLMRMARLCQAERG